MKTIRYKATIEYEWYGMVDDAPLETYEKGRVEMDKRLIEILEDGEKEYTQVEINSKFYVHDGA